MSLAEIGVQKIWVEELTYPDIFPMINKLKLQVETVPMAPADMLERCNILKEKDALYLIPSFHNPTGRTMDYETRKEVLALAKKKGFWIIEDDAYGELRYSAQSVPAMKAMENAEKVIYLGSFSQLLFPGLRNGYALVPNQLKEEFREALACSAGTVSSLVQYLVSAFLSEGLLENCLERARKEISKRMDCLISSIEKLLPHALAEKPLGGIYLWVTLPGLSDESLHALALSEDISVVPGKEFTKDKRETFSVRLSVSSLGINDLKQAVERLAKAWGDKQ
jgi:GntR family transcriptional regulator/MocR family aminotransferase